MWLYIGKRIVFSTFVFAAIAFVAFGIICLLPGDFYTPLDFMVRAFGLDPTRIYLHRTDRFPSGSVDPAEIPALSAEIRDKAMALEFEGEKAFQGAFRPEEIYHGPETERAPDLVLLARDGFDVKGWMRTGEIFGRSHFTGMHNWDDAFLWSADPPPEGFDITSVAGMIEGRLTGGGEGT